jgi:O-antigen/teichoic acid export membrane protein
MFLLAARLFGATAGFVVQLLLARQLTPAQLGIYFAATSLLVIGGVISAHGYPSIVMRFVSRYREPVSGALLRGFVRHAQTETTVLALLIAAVVAAAAAWPGFGSDSRWAIVIAATAIPAAACFRLYGSLSTATRSFALAYLPDVCLKPVVILASLTIIILLAGELSLTAVMLTVAGATIALSLAQAVLLARRFPVNVNLWPRFSAKPRYGRTLVSRKWRREAHAVLLVAVFAQFFPELSILMATPVLSAPEMGAFGICLKLTFLVGFFVSMTQNIMMPDLADALAKPPQHRGTRRFAASCSAATALTGAFTLLCVLWGEHLLRVFGEEFAIGRWTLVMLAAAQMATAAGGPASAVLTLVGQQRVNLLLAVAGISVLAASTSALGFLYGLNGAAAAVLLTTLFWATACGITLFRRTGVRVDLFCGRGSQPAQQERHEAAISPGQPSSAS